jgi:CheY-like chemotaxis protein
VKILCVDDHELFRDGLRSALSGLSPEPELLEAHTGQQALELLERDPDVGMVLVDLTLPDWDGLALLRAVRARFPTVAAVVVSALRAAPGRAARGPAPGRPRVGPRDHRERARGAGPAGAGAGDLGGPLAGGRGACVASRPVRAAPAGARGRVTAARRLHYQRLRAALAQPGGKDMSVRTRIRALAIPLGIFLAGPAGAQATAPPATTPAPPPGTACVRARDLASAEEFAAHQGRLRAAQTDEQRAQELASFMTEMRARAKAKNQSFCRDVMGGPGLGRGPGGRQGGGPPAPPAPPE